MQPDTIFISQLRIDAVIGVHQHERAAPQTLLLDVELTTDTRCAAHSDALSDTIDYQQLAHSIAAWAAEKPRDLIETLANELADKLLGTTSAHAVRVRVHKFPSDVPAGSVGVEITRASREL